ncbi:hypothetical protein NliqN6_2445 [Naganishia liquefaciens]|uniref:FHA domain-containing protein n=1 Tax=Naganishia liquefaciens TaxID=104408 RepID=A0A8H3TSE9_9TREE|nr:hypothetical protein NliqN6_2445 [Naganishia liquefaciens]
MLQERSPSPDIPQPVVYARLHHFRGKSSAAREGKSKQVYNIDALQVVFGREESCDIRIYADNISRKHCKITIDLLTGQATLHVLSSHGLKLNKVLLPGGTHYDLRDDDIINVMDRKFRFEYASSVYDEQDESHLTSMSTLSPTSKPRSAFRPSIVQPIIPPSPGPISSASPARRPSTRIASTPLRQAPSTRMHLFPKDYASEEVRSALVDIGVEVEPTQGLNDNARSGTPGRKARKEDYVYLEDRDELDSEETPDAPGTLAVVACDDEAGDNSRPLNKGSQLSAFSTPQPAKKITRVPRTSLAPRTKKATQTEKRPVEMSAALVGSGTKDPTPQTPSSVPLPPPAETPYHSGPPSAATSTPSIYPSLDQLSSFAMPQTPTPQSYPAETYKTPREIPLPAGGDTPYGAGLYGAQINAEEVEDVEMEDVFEIEANRQQASPEQSRSPSPHLLAMASTPVTPRNVPLPMGGETPYQRMPATPISAFARTPEPTSPEEEEPSMAMPETPRAIRPLDGPVSLRRRLLLRSAHKVMQEQASRRDMRRTMGVGSGLIGTPMRPQRGMDRSSMLLPVSRPMSPITESAIHGETPSTPSPNLEAEQSVQMTPSRVALPSPGGTQYEASFDDEEDEEEPTDYAEPLKDHDDNEDNQVSLSMYQTDAGEDEGEGEDEDAEGETDDEEQGVIHSGGSGSSPATPAGHTDNETTQQGMYFDGLDGADAMQFPSPSASQTLFSSHEMDTDDDFVDRSLDVSQEISDEEADDQAENENESQNEGLDETSPAYDADHQQVDVISVGSDEEGDEKENEPVSEDDGREMLVAEVPPSTPASPSRAVRRNLAEEYYTPQPLNRKTDRRGMFGRKSLSSLGGPAVRGTPRSDLAPMKNAFARMSISERDTAKREDQDADMREQSTSPDPEVKAEDKLPQTPPQTSRHPAMSVSDNDSSAVEVVSTPLQGLKNKLKDLRRKSTHFKQEDASDDKPFDRRATFGVSTYDMPNTRSSGFEQRGMSSAAPLSRFIPKLEKPSVEGETAPDMQEPEGNSTENDLHGEDDSASVSQGEDGDFPHEADQEEREEEQTKGHSSADEIELRQGDKAVSLEESKNPATPMLKGLREMMRTPKAQPGTPRFAGLREMFAAKPEVATPEMAGIVDLFPELASSRQEAAAEQESESSSAAGPSVSRLPTRNRAAAPPGSLPAPARTTSRVAAPGLRTRAKPAAGASSTSKPTASVASTGLRRARAPPAPEPVTSNVNQKVTRTRQAQELASSTSTEEASVPVRRTTARPIRTRATTAEVEEKPAVKPAAKTVTRTTTVRTRAKSAAPDSDPLEEEDNDADPLDDISVPEPDPEDIKPVRRTTRAPTAARTTRAPTAARTAGARPLATRSALPQPSIKVENLEAEKPKTRARTTAAPTSRILQSSTETEEVVAPVPKRATRAAVGSRLTAPTASSKARATPPPASAPVAPVRKTRAATATIAEAAEVSGIPKRVTRARK